MDLGDEGQGARHAIKSEHQVFWKEHYRRDYYAGSPILQGPDAWYEQLLQLRQRS